MTSFVLDTRHRHLEPWDGGVTVGSEVEGGVRNVERWRSTARYAGRNETVTREEEAVVVSRRIPREGAESAKPGGRTPRAPRSAGGN